MKLIGLGHFHTEKATTFGSLQFRKKMPETCKIMHRMDRRKLFSLSHNTRTKGHLLKLTNGRVRTGKIK